MKVRLAFHHKISNSYYIPEHRASVFVAQGVHAPSLVVNNMRICLDEQGNHPNFNGRPTELHGTPVNPRRSQGPGLCNLSKAPEPLFDSIVQTGKLFYTSTHIYVTESLRIDAILNPLSQLLGAELERSIKVPKEGIKRVSTEGDAAIRVTLTDRSHDTKVVIVAYVTDLNYLQYDEIRKAKDRIMLGQQDPACLLSEHYLIFSRSLAQAPP
jgi:hypothetical protein